MDNCTTIFLKLLSAAIHDRDFTADIMPAPADWKRLYEYSLSQNVLPMIYDRLGRSGIWDAEAESLIQGRDEELGHEDRRGAWYYKDLLRQEE